MTRKGTSKKVMVIVAISVLVAVHFIIHLLESGMEAEKSDIFNDEPGNTDYSPDAEIEDKELVYDFPEMDTGHFTENLGQWDDHIRFLAKTSFGYIGLGNDGIYYYVMNENGGQVIFLRKRPRKMGQGGKEL
jgi:hypothetical protein